MEAMSGEVLLFTVFCQIFHSINPTFMCRESSRLSYKSYQWQSEHRHHPLPPPKKKLSSTAISPYYMKYMAANIMYDVRKGSVIFKMLNIIQICLLLSSPHFKLWRTLLTFLSSAAELNFVRYGIPNRRQNNQAVRPNIHKLQGKIEEVVLPCSYHYYWLTGM